jgi:integrase-like protein
VIIARVAEQRDLELDDLFVTIGHRFGRVELRRRMRDYVRGLLAPVARKNSWQLVEQAGHATPDGLQRLLAGAKWNPDDIRDELQEYVADKLGENGSSSSTTPGSSRRASPPPGFNASTPELPGSVRQLVLSAAELVERWSMAVRRADRACVGALKAKFDQFLPHLDERRRRLYLASEATAIGHGGIALVAATSRISMATITRGIAELARGSPPTRRVRGLGAGRKPLTVTDPGLLEALIEPHTNRHFEARRPNQLWVADLTYIRTWSGWVYAAFVLDVYSRMIVGWQLATHMRTDLPLDAQEMALWRRSIKKGSGLIHHTTPRWPATA